jgi:hypothetical protein
MFSSIIIIIIPVFSSFIFMSSFHIPFVIDTEKPAIEGTHDEEKQSENVLDTTICKQTQTRHKPSHKQLEAKTN